MAVTHLVNKHHLSAITEQSYNQLNSRLSTRLEDRFFALKDSMPALNTEKSMRRLQNSENFIDHLQSLSENNLELVEALFGKSNR